jgi:DNA-binding response OmpR family regulator
MTLEMLEAALKAHYDVTTARDGAAALAIAQTQAFDLIVLDVDMPDMDGYETCKALKAESRTADVPILFLSAKVNIEERLRGYRAGGADYLTKPFDVSELEARLRVLIRRMQGGRGDNQIELGPLRLDMNGRRAWLDGEDLSLTAKEFALMQMLAMKHGQVQPKEQLISRLSDFEQDTSVNALDILVHRLRKKLDGSALSIRTLRGFGYLLEHKP